MSNIQLYKLPTGVIIKVLCENGKCIVLTGKNAPEGEGSHLVELSEVDFAKFCKNNEVVKI